MLDSRLEALREKGYSRAEKIGADIAGRIKQDIGEGVQFVICAAYFAYLASEHNVSDAAEMTNYISEHEPKLRKLMEQRFKGAWSVLFDMKEQFTRDDLLAVVLWYTGDARADAGSVTPVGIARLAARLLALSPGDRVADLCSGIGGFLSEVLMNYAVNDCIGVELDEEVAAASDIRLGLMSEYVRIWTGSVFSTNIMAGTTADTVPPLYDKIFCNFPFGRLLASGQTVLAAGQIEALKAFLPGVERCNTADWYYIVNGLLHLKEGGKMVAVLTAGFTLNGGFNKLVREELVKRGYIETVILLSDKLFANTAVSAVLLVLSRGNEKIRMIDARKLSVSGRRQNVLSDDNIDRIMELLHTDSDFSASVQPDEIKKKDYAINPVRFFGNGMESAHSVTLGNIARNITRGVQIKASELDTMISDKPTGIKYLTLAHVHDSLIEDELPFLSGIERRLERYCVRDKSLIISKNGLPVKLAVASVAEGEILLGSGNLYIIELDESRLDPFFLQAYLESSAGKDALMRIMVGDAMPSISVEDLKNLKIPMPPLSAQVEVAEEFRKKLQELKELKRREKLLLDELKEVFSE